MGLRRSACPTTWFPEVRLRRGPLQRSWGLTCVDMFTPDTGTMKLELMFFQLSAEEAEMIASELRPG